MDQGKTEKKCNKICAMCDRTDCPEDYRAECFGIKCQSCQLDCRLKSVGIRKKQEISAETFAATHFNKQKLRYIDGLETVCFSNMETIKDPIQRIRLDTIREMAFYYLEHPVEFEKFVVSCFLAENQSDLAKKRGISRQAISKAIRTERLDNLKKEIAELKKRNAAFSQMTSNELKIYQLCGEDGVLNISSVAKQSGLSRPTVYKILHDLREKYGICFTLNDGEKRKKRSF